MSKMRMRNSSIGIDQEDPEQITLLSNNILSYNDKKGEEVFKAHTESVSQLLNRFGINDLEKGLSSKQVELQRHKYGRNELPKEPTTPLYKLILEQFNDNLVIILLLAAIISFLLALIDEDMNEVSLFSGAFVEPFVILTILVANATVGVVQETNAEKAIEALKSYSPDEAKVIRDGELKRILSEEVVVGDVLQLDTGDKIAADSRVVLLKSGNFKCDQAILTGESNSVGKEVNVVKDAGAVLQDQLNMAFSGTSVTFGHALCVVVRIGANTILGKVHSEMTANETDDKTPLKKKLDEFGDQLAKYISVICLLVWVINIGHFRDHGTSESRDLSYISAWVKGAIYYFKIAVALAVAAIPEGLAVIITTCLALGTKRMAKKNAIVRSLPSVETLGCTQIICSDKTGTLTTNRMTVQRFFLFQSSAETKKITKDCSVELVEFEVKGHSYEPKGEIRMMPGKANSRSSDDFYTFRESLIDISRVMAVCNDARLTSSLSGESTNDVSSMTYGCLGEPTEAALLVLVEKIGRQLEGERDDFLSLDDDEEFTAPTGGSKGISAYSDIINRNYPRIATLDFDRDRKSMGVIVNSTTCNADDSNSLTVWVKGAPESLLERSTQLMVTKEGLLEEVPLTASLKASILEKCTQYGREALRQLAVAKVTISKRDYEGLLLEGAPFCAFERSMIFMGVVGMADPPRPQVKGAIDACQEAGIRVIMVTGDQKHTAEAICRKLGLLPCETNTDGKNIVGDSNPSHFESMTGREWESLSKEDRLRSLSTLVVMSRTEPHHKTLLVEAFQSSDLVVAMTGDGVNDAAALKKADIGIAMGSGTDVAKLAADMVLADDSFTTIVEAVKEGRAIYANTKQFIRYLISSNIGEVVSIFLTVLLNLPEALLPVQLLWVNLVTDGLPATALGFNPTEPTLMKESPRGLDEPIVTPWLLIRYCAIGCYVGVATVAIYIWHYCYDPMGPAITVQLLRYGHLNTANFALYSSSTAKLSWEFLFGKSSTFPVTASTLSLSVLVVIEMLNAMNSLSQNISLVVLTPLKNPYLILAICLSLMLHLIILQISSLNAIFHVTSLTFGQWSMVMALSVPVLLLDELLKYVSRKYRLR